MNRKKKKRLLLVSEIPLGMVSGLAKTIRTLLTHATAEGYEIIIIAPKDIRDTPEEIAALAKYIQLVRSFPIPQYTVQRVAFCSQRYVRKLLEEFRPDIVHTVDPYLLGGPFVRACFKYAIPVVASFHTNIPKYLRHYNFVPLTRLAWAWIRANYRFATEALGPTNAIIDELGSHGIFCMTKWSRGIDSDRFNPRHRDDQLRRRLLDGREYLAMYVGRLAAEKNVEFLIDSLLPLQQVRLVIIGDGPKREHLEKKYHGSGVIFAGLKTGKDLLKYYASGDVFVFASKTETFGQVLNEALASGLPVVAVDCPVTREVLTANPPGKIVAQNTVEFRSAVVDVLQDRFRYSAIARSLSLERTWKLAMAGLFRAYELAMSKFETGVIRI